TGVGGAPTTRSEPARRGPAPMIAAFFELGSMVPGGLPYQPWAKALKDQRTKDNAKDNPDAHCLPLGNMQLHLHPERRKIIQGKNEIVILYEGNAGVRQIFTDGRSLPAGDPQPYWFGYSTGKWEGDTLVVQTAGFRDGGSPVDAVKAGHVALAENEEFFAKADASDAAAIVISLPPRESRKPLIRVRKTTLALAKMLAIFHPVQKPEPGVHPTAFVGRD